jgi:hypothetical protein
MNIKITDEESSVAGFISWRRLAEELMRRGAEIGPHEHIVSFDVGERGINYFTRTSRPVSNGHQGGGE